MCQQPEVGELVISAVCTLSGGRYDVHNPQDFDVASQLPPHGQDLIKLFLHQVYSGDDLIQWAAQEEERWMTGVEGAESDDSDAGDRYGIIDASDMEESDDESMDLSCTLCGVVGGDRMHYNMQHPGPYAGLIICSDCYDDSHGDIESFF